MPPTARSERTLLVMALVAGLAAHAVALGHPFVFDDQLHVLGNPSIRDLANLRWIAIGSRRVLTNFSLAVDWALFGPNPVGWHATNLLLHLVAVALAFRLARRLGLATLGTFTVAALLAVHPLAIEAVGYVSSRGALLSAVFVLAATIAFHRAIVERRRVAWLLAVGLWALAVLSKETAVVAPIVWAAVDWLATDDAMPARRRRLLTLYLPVTLAAIAFALVRWASYLRLEGGFQRPPWQQLLTQVTVVWRYLFLFLVPAGQSLVHDVPTIASPWSPRAIPALLALVVVLVVIGVRRREDPRTLLGALWFLAFLLPSSAVPLQQHMAEHRVYEASFGLFLIAGTQLERLAVRVNARRVAIGVGVALLMLTLTSLARHRVWSSAVTLWQDAVEKSPRHWGARYALADALRARGDCERAVEHYRLALALQPSESRARKNLAICLSELRRFEEARVELLRALEAAPRDPSLHFNLGAVAVEAGQIDAARRHFLRALEVDPTHRRSCEMLRNLYPSHPPPAICHDSPTVME